MRERHSVNEALVDRAAAGHPVAVHLEAGRDRRDREENDPAETQRRGPRDKDPRRDKDHVVEEAGARRRRNS